MAHAATLCENPLIYAVFRSVAEVFGAVPPPRVLHSSAVVAQSMGTIAQTARPWSPDERSGDPGSRM
jgi:hypothetical protein